MYKNALDEVTTIKYDTTIRRLSDVSPHKGLAHFSLQWALIISLIAGFEYFKNNIPFVPLMFIYILFTALIASRQHALGVLLHEAVHHRLSKLGSLNEFIGEWLIAWPLHITLYGYRKQHFTHHRNLGSSFIEYGFTRG